MPAARFALAALLPLALLLAACTPPPAGEAPAPLILVSFDGFRWDYPGRVPMPTLERLAREGVRAERLVPSFPTKTYPNHYTLVTGLHPDHHGIVANTMWDDSLGGFSLSRRETVEDARWWGGEPLWLTAERAGLATAPMFWPGSEAPIGGVRPAYWARYDGRVPYATLVDSLLARVSRPPGERPSFLTLYWSRLDGAGHRHGPDAPEVDAALHEAEAVLARLVEGLEARGLLDDVHLVVTSDHGMADTDASRVVFLEELVDTARVDVVDWTPVAMLDPEAGYVDEAVAALDAHPRLRAWHRADVPGRLHFGTHPRVPAVVAVADEGWSIGTRGALAERPGMFDGGTHGYDPAAASMSAVFVARGPRLRAGARLDTLATVDVYPLLARLLGLEPAPSDGDVSATEALMR